MANKLFHKLRETADEVIVLKVACTGKAAMNIDGQTIHSAFALKKNMKLKYQPLGESDLNTLRAKLANIQLLIIDEVSMVSKTVLSYISGRLNQIKSLHQNSKPFGGISVLCVGDFYQIPPVFGKSLLCVPQDLWTLFKVPNLQKIMRQKEDSPFAKTLNTIRTKDRSDPMNEEVKNLLKTCLVNEDYPNDAIHIFSTNEQVKNHNFSKLQQLGKQIISLTAVDILHSAGGRIYKRQTPFENLDTCLQPELKLAIGARVMLTVNIDTSDGLVNGALGTLMDFVNGAMPYGLPEFLLVQFDDKHIGSNYRICNPSHCCNERYISFRLLSQKVPYKTAYITRYQFPFTLSWACTIHKIQGQTFDKAVVSLKRIFKGGMAYVALSRVTHLKGLSLLDYDPTVIYADLNVKKFLDQMEIFSLTDSNPVFPERKNNLLLIHHNVQSLSKHFLDVKKMIDLYTPDLFCITETWLGEEKTEKCYDVTGFHLQCVKSVKDRGARLAVYLKNNISFHVMTSEASSDYEMICILLPKLSTMVVTVYRHCSASPTSILSMPQHLLKICKSNNIPKVVVLGDFNSSKGEVNRSFVSAGFVQVLDTPTTTGGSALDNIFVHNISSFSSGVLCSYFSFHLPIYISISIDNVVHMEKEERRNSVKESTRIQNTRKISENSKKRRTTACKHNVAANTAWILHNTCRWKETDIQPTLDKNIISQYNSILGIPGCEPQLLMDTQIIEILAHLHNTKSSSEPFTWMDGPMPINFFILGLRRSLAGRRTRKDSKLRIAIVNTTPTDSSSLLTGDHRITIAYTLFTV